MPARRRVIAVAPVDHPSSPLDGARGTRGGPGRPKTELNSRWGVWELADAVNDSVGLLDGAHGLAIDLEDQRVGRPHETVVVIIIVCVAQTVRDATVAYRHSLKKVVRLAFRRGRSRKLPIDLVANIAHGNERRHHPIPASGFHSCRDRSIVDVSSRRKTDAVVRLSKEQVEFPIGNVYLTSVQDPIILGRIAGIESRIRKNARFVVESVCRGLADGIRLARVEGVRLERVAAAEAELASSPTPAEFTTAGGYLRT